MFRKSLVSLLMAACLIPAAMSPVTAQAKETFKDVEGLEKLQYLEDDGVKYDAEFYTEFEERYKELFDMEKSTVYGSKSLDFQLYEENEPTVGVKVTSTPSMESGSFMVTLTYGDMKKLGEKNADALLDILFKEVNEYYDVDHDRFKEKISKEMETGETSFMPEKFGDTAITSTVIDIMGKSLSVSYRNMKKEAYPLDKAWESFEKVLGHPSGASITLGDATEESSASVSKTSIKYAVGEPYNTESVFVSFPEDSDYEEFLSKYIDVEGSDLSKNKEKIIKAIKANIDKLEDGIFSESNDDFTITISEAEVTGKMMKYVSISVNK